ncbi:MAG: hypothetical protein EBY17_26110 [Acidobacteriia bacterium]|nr:hypothetical protein [Terriglobia bacterium]
MNAKPTTSISQTSNGMNSCKNQLRILAVVGVMQQPISKVQPQPDGGRFVIRALPVHPLIHFHPGPYSDSNPRWCSSQSATGDAGPSVVKCSQARIKPMKLQIQIAKTELPPERLHDATVKSIKPKGESKCTIEFGIVFDGTQFTVCKDSPAKLDRTSELFRDAQTILGKKFDEAEANVDFDLDTLVGKVCQVVVIHKRTNGGRVVAAVETVLPAVSAQPVAA